MRREGRGYLCRPAAHSPKATMRARRTFLPGGPADGIDVVLERRQLLAVDVLTYHNDLGRTGQNLAETFLTPTTVAAATFGKLGQVAVDGMVYTQPLVKTKVNVPGLGLHDLVFVATEHDSVYAFDANTLQSIWQDSLIDPANGMTAV